MCMFACPKPGIGLTTGPTGGTLFPQLSITDGGWFCIRSKWTVDSTSLIHWIAKGNLSMVYVYVQSAIVVLSQAYIDTSKQLNLHKQVVWMIQPNTALTVLPQASIISAGAPGSIACTGHETVDMPFVGGIKPPIINGIRVGPICRSRHITCSIPDMSITTEPSQQVVLMIN